MKCIKHLKKNEMRKYFRVALTGMFLSLFLVQGCKNPGSDRGTSLSSYIDPSAPKISALSPADEDATVDTTTKITVTFDEPMNTASITGISSGTACSGAVQLSTDNFSTCLNFSSTVDSSNDGQTFALTPSPSINGLTTYKIKLTSTAKSEGSAALAEQTTTFTTRSLSSGTFPEDGGNKTSWSRIKIVYDTTIDVNTVTVNTSDTSCNTGSIQISDPGTTPDFTTCIQFAADPTADQGNTTFVMKPLSDLSVDTTYKGKFTTAVTGSKGQTNLTDYIWTFTTTSRELVPDTSQDDDYSNYPQSYTASGDTIIDQVTNLVWQKCSVGFSGATCDTTSDAKTWADSSSFCSDATTDSLSWRFPTVSELAMIVDWGTFNPSINGIFPNTQSSCYWTSSSSPGETPSQQYINYKFGNVFDSDASDTCYSRCVKNDPVTASSFSDPGDGTIWDNKTGLMWQKCAKGQSGTDCSSGSVEHTKWAVASSYCKDSIGPASDGLLAGHNNWRLPTINELESLIDRLQSESPLIDPKFEGAAIAHSYWSSTIYDAAPTNRAWSTDFNTGVVDSKSNIESYYIRCVR